MLVVVRWLVVAMIRPSGAPPSDLDVTIAVARALLDAQCPQLAHLPLQEVQGGWDNAIFRVGEEYVVRIPVRASAAELIANEARWLRVVTADVPIATPLPVYVGHAEAGYPWPWLVARWIEGEPVESLPVDERGRLVEALADTLRAIHRPAPGKAPRNGLRGIPLAGRPGAREQILAAFGADSPLLTVWDRAVAAPPYAGPRLWLHGDPHPFNLLHRNGVLVGLIDFGDVCAGDPASDLACAWWVFGTRDRRRFQVHLNAGGPYDDAVWTRAAGWAALFAALMAPGTSLHASARHMAAELGAG